MIPTTPKVEADLEDVSPILPGIAEWMHLAPLAIGPDDGDDGDTVPQVAGDGEEFDIEGGDPRSSQPMRHGVEEGPPEDLLRHVAAEELETALSVLDARQDEAADQPVENTAHDVAIERFAEAAGADPLARSDGDIRSIGESPPKLVDEAERGCQIGVAEGDLIEGGGGHSGPDGDGFAAVGDGDDLCRDGAGEGGPAKVGGAIDAAIVDEDQFGRVGLGGEKGEHGGNRVGDPSRLVVRGDD